MAGRSGLKELTRYIALISILSFAMNRKIPPITSDNVDQIVFFKRDELTTDLICCEITIITKGSPVVWFVHEEADEWTMILLEMENLQGFDKSWPEKVIKPPFVENRTIAFSKTV